MKDLQTTWLTGCDHYEAYLCPRCGWCFVCAHQLVYPETWICGDGGRRPALQTTEVEIEELARMSLWIGEAHGLDGEARGLDAIRARWNLRGWPLNPPENMNIPEVEYDYDEETKTWTTHYNR